jgi:hypothetical protein
MRLTNFGSDYICIDEDNLEDEQLLSIPRVHLIKLDFMKPTEMKVRKVLELYHKTNRFVVETNIKTYNYILRGTNKKYYIENAVGSKVITFFKKNNKVLVNFNNLSTGEKSFLLDNFDDVLRNTEVVIIDQEIFDEKKDQLDRWSGNVIISNGGLL